jgi:CHAD domain-containing protein
MSMEGADGVRSNAIEGASFKHEPFTLGEFPLTSIQKNFHKSIKHETEIFKDRDPEPLHQMRVGTRGQLHDSQVFDDFLIQEIGSQWKEAIPSLERYLRKQYLELWQQWQPIRQKYLQTQFRDDLRMLLLRPAIALSLSQQ